MAIYDFFQNDSYRNLADNYGSASDGAGTREAVSTANTIKETYGIKTPNYGQELADSNKDVGAMTQNTGVKKGSGINMNTVASIGAGIGRMIPTTKPMAGETEATTRGVAAVNASKDAIGAAIPFAGLFRGVEKLAGQAGQAIDGDKGQAITEGYFSPVQTVGKINQDSEISGKNKVLGSIATLALPFGGTIGGNMINKANERRVQKQERKDKFLKKTKQEQLYYDKQDSESLKKLENMQNAQMNYINTKFS